MDDSDDLSARLFPMATYFMCIDNGSTTVFSAFTMASGGNSSATPAGMAPRAQMTASAQLSISLTFCTQQQGRND